MLNIIPTKQPLNPDQNVNHGCTLKWKLGDRQEYRLYTIVLRRSKITIKHQ
ncbi:hypothetical protein [Okeania sp. SIO2B3]|uniref:hypothetical protein n=1 Tax=Okeania sp. SIO2B3 TaxID=2607784 RepID=UPI0013C179D4|nr:hypothetical protein [Okeania sp. SIO2B3]NET44555.1 hypothetical protein [Okeania sp. SIO2B3]